MNDDFSHRGDLIGNGRLRVFGEPLWREVICGETSRTATSGDHVDLEEAVRELRHRHDPVTEWNAGVKVLGEEADGFNAVRLTHAEDGSCGEIGSVASDSSKVAESVEQRREPWPNACGAVL